LIENKARDWHLLRLYAAGSLPGSLVTPLRKPGRKPAPPPTVSTQFLDPAGKIKVPTRESFVGRRQQLQSCLRVVSQSSDAVGVLIHGMGGLGKSSLAARLCDRLPNFERVVWVGRIDEASLVSRLAEKLDDSEQRKSLQNYDEELKFRLRRVFQQLHDAAKSFLLVLDDFEGNLEPRNDGYVLQTEAAEVLTALMWAIRENSTSHRIIITCRYDFEFTQLQHFYKQPLDALFGADLRKKCDRLTAFNAKSQVDEALKLQGQKLADGNPRLLEWLDKILQNPTVDHAAILSQLAVNPVELREQVLAQTLLQQMDTTMREMLSRGLVFELPVPREALAAVCEDISNLEDYISRAVALGLLEVSHDEALRVPRILPVQLAKDGEGLCKEAAEVLYRLWWEESETFSEGQSLEIHRLALLGKAENIAVQVATTLTDRWIEVTRFREAAKVCRETLENFKDYHLLHNLALSEQEIGLIEQAFEYYQQVLNICPVEDDTQKAETFYEMGRLKADLGKINEAIELFKQSLSLREQIGDAQGKAWTLHEMGRIKADSGKTNEAMELFEQSFALREQIGDTQGKAWTLLGLGALKTKMGQFNKAIDIFEQTLILYEQIGSIKGKAWTLLELGKLKNKTGEINEAVGMFQQSLTLHEQIDNIQGKAYSLWCLGDLAEQQSDYNQALDFLQLALEIFQRMQSPHAEVVRQVITRVQGYMAG
jgi:tetratricopeptide (TPR) repeat protein